MTLREVVETGLRQVLASDEGPAKPYRYKSVGVGGQGMVKDMPWSELLEMIYEGRGGA